MTHPIQPRGKFPEWKPKADPREAYAAEHGMPADVRGIDMRAVDPDEWAKALIAALEKDPGLATNLVRLSGWFAEFASRCWDRCPQDETYS